MRTRFGLEGPALGGSVDDPLGGSVADLFFACSSIIPCIWTMLSPIVATVSSSRLNRTSMSVDSNMFTIARGENGKPKSS